jgi:hypothetical protein
MRLLAFPAVFALADSIALARAHLGGLAAQ